MARSMIDIQGGYLYIHCDYHHRHLAKRVPSSRWDSKKKAWKCNLDTRVVEEAEMFFRDLIVTPEVREFVEYKHKARKYLASLKEIPGDQITGLNLPYKDKLRDYQKVGINYMVVSGRCILADDMGVGKTLQAISTCEHLGLDRVLIICPNSLKWTWADEIDKWTGKQATVLEGLPEERKAIIDNYETGYLIVNYVQVRIHPELKKTKWDAKIVDEAHKIKNRKAERTKALKRIKSDKVYLLSGTPMLNRPEELWSLLNTLYPKTFSSFWAFCERYCYLHDNGYGTEVLVGTAAQNDRLKKILSPIMLRREKKDVLKELPDKIYQDIIVELGEKQRKIYDQMQEEALIEISSGEYVAAPVIIAKITRLRQLAISPRLIDENSIVQDSSKIETLIELIENNQDNHKMVVFSQFKKAIHLVEKELNQREIRTVSITGDVSQDDRRKATKELQEGNARVMLATIQAAGLGLTWTAADIAIFLDRHWTPAINRQAEDRLHRMGQKSSVQIINLIAKDTIEAVINRKLKRKSKIFNDLINNSFSLEEIISLFDK